MRYLRIGLLISAITAAHSATAELFVHPTPADSNGEVSLYYGSSEVGYVLHEEGISADFDIERSFVSGAFTKPISRQLSVFGFGGFFLESKAKINIAGLSVSSPGGNGFVFGGGAIKRLNLGALMSLPISVYTQFSYYSEDYGTDTEQDGRYQYESSSSGSGYELSIGAVASKPLSQGLEIWGGAEITPLANWDAELTEKESIGGRKLADDTETISFDRDGIFTIRLGADYGPFTASFSLISESTFMIGYRMRWGGGTPYKKTSASPSPTKPRQASRPVSQPSTPEASPTSATFYASPVQSAQRALTAFGYDPGPADGIMGGKTRRALRLFQQDQGLPVTGRLDRATRTALGID